LSKRKPGLTSLPQKRGPRSEKKKEVHTKKKNVYEEWPKSFGETRSIISTQGKKRNV